MTNQDVYTHGHHESVLRSHRWRTAENSAAYLLAELRPGMRVLDVGCGPGTITIDVAKCVAPGEVIGVDRVAEPFRAAREEAAKQGVSGVSFRTGDVYDLDFEDDSFDVVHAHQLLHHLTDPVAALREMRRLAKPGGIVAVRESDFGAKTWYPTNPGLDDWLRLYHQVAEGNGAEPDAGRRLYSWARAAGFTEITPSASTWCFATEADRSWWGGSWADRVTRSAFAAQALERGLATSSELERLAQAWRHWARQEDGWFLVVHGEVICRA